MEGKIHMELLKDINEALNCLYDGNILTMNGKDFYVLKGEKVFCYNEGTRFSLDLKDFIDLYNKSRFYLFEESAEIDETKDEAYYRYYRK